MKTKPFAGSSPACTRLTKVKGAMSRVRHSEPISRHFSLRLPYHEKLNIFLQLIRYCADYKHRIYQACRVMNSPAPADPASTTERSLNCHQPVAGMLIGGAASGGARTAAVTRKIPRRGYGGESCLLRKLKPTEGMVPNACKKR